MLIFDHLEETTTEGERNAHQQNLKIHLAISPVSAFSGASRSGESEPAKLADSQEPGEIRALLGLKKTTDNIYLFSLDTLPLVPFDATPTLALVPQKTDCNDSAVKSNGRPKLALCKRCALNGNQRDGGGLGVCKIHAKSKCRSYGCDAKTLGAELCAAHAHQEELARWKAKAEFRVIDPDDDFDALGLRREKLMTAKFLAHQSVEVFFRSLLEASGALYGEEPEADEERKAA